MISDVMEGTPSGSVDVGRFVSRAWCLFNTPNNELAELINSMNYLMTLSEVSCDICTAVFTLFRRDRQGTRDPSQTFPLHNSFSNSQNSYSNTGKRVIYLSGLALFGGKKLNAITVTCPADGEKFMVVEPEEPSSYSSLTATCPTCNENFAIVYPEEIRESRSKRPVYEKFNAGIVEWEQKEDAPAPYTGSQEAIPYEQYITAKIGGLGGAPNVEEMSKSHEEALKPDRFQIWYTPEHDEISYVVRADFETGVKTKNVYANSAGGLFVKNRGVPRDSDKQWTYLDRDECYARAAQAGLDDEMRKVEDNRFNIFLRNREEPLVDEDGELAEELVCELAQMHAAFQTKRIN